MFVLKFPANGGVGKRRTIHILDIKPPLHEGRDTYTLWVPQDTLGIGGQTIPGFTGIERIAVIHLTVRRGEVVEAKPDMMRSRDAQQEILRGVYGKEMYP